MSAAAKSYKNAVFGDVLVKKQIFTRLNDEKPRQLCGFLTKKRYICALKYRRNFN
jgi:hypothetical protein